MEQHGSRRKVTDFNKGKSLGTKDHLIDLDKPKRKPYWMGKTEYQAAPSSIRVRELRVGNKTLITTLCDPKCAHKNELKLLYKKRWSIELDLRDIKDTPGMGVLSCKTPEMTVKAIWIYLLAHNLIRLMMTQAALLPGITPREISFKHNFQLWIMWNQ